MTAEQAMELDLAQASQQHDHASATANAGAGSRTEDAHYSFFLSIVEPDAEHGRSRYYFAGWVHGEVLLDRRRYRRGETGDVEPFDDPVGARAGLRRAYRAVAGAEDFEAAWKQGVALFKALTKERRL